MIRLLPDNHAGPHCRLIGLGLSASDGRCIDCGAERRQRRPKGWWPPADIKPAWVASVDSLGPRTARSTRASKNSPKKSYHIFNCHTFLKINLILIFVTVVEFNCEWGFISLRTNQQVAEWNSRRQVLASLIVSSIDFEHFYFTI